MKSTVAVVPASSFVRQRAQLEPLRHLRRLRQQLVRVEVSSSAGSATSDPVVRPEELVRRADVEVGAECGHVDGCVRRQVDAVDVEQRRRPHGPPPRSPGCPGGCRAGWRHRSPRRPWCAPTAGLDVCEVELAGLAVELDPAQRRTACSAAVTHGRMLPSWSSRVTTTSSPADHPLASARETSYVSWVIDRPKTTPPASAPSRSATACRAPSTIASARRSAAVTVPRFEIPEQIACRDRVARRRRHLGATRAVEVGDAVAERGERLTGSFEVEGHLGIVPPAQAERSDASGSSVVA